MARPRKQIDEVVLIKLRESGKTQEEISKELGISIPTVTRRLAVLCHEKGILTKYRQLQSLQLTELQVRILEAVDSKNIEDAPLIDLLRAFHVHWKVEKSIQGKESFKVWGLLDHLLELDKYSIKQ